MSIVIGSRVRIKTPGREPSQAMFHNKLGFVVGWCGLVAMGGAYVKLDGADDDKTPFDPHEMILLDESAVKPPFYLAVCRGCGYRNTSEAFIENRREDDADIICPKCHCEDVGEVE